MGNEILLPAISGKDGHTRTADPPVLGLQYGAMVNPPAARVLEFKTSPSALMRSSTLLMLDLAEPADSSVS
jgi:hypothetical protein